ncbi:MAG: response regulator transcription factor [Calditrichales bacterium]|nr:MAG: response regulator transcription factor [Calditrichales bacterium]
MNQKKAKNTDKKIRILIADAHKIFCQALSILLNTHEGIEVVGQAYSGQTAVERSRELSPDIVLMDISFADFEGTTAIRRILEKSTDIRIIALTMHSGREYFQKMMKAGASGYVVKDCGIEELLRAIQMVYGGKSYLCNGMANLLIESYLCDDNRPGKNLTEREREVLQCIAEGISTKKIAVNLNISTKTVETHRRQIMQKLDIFNVPQLTKYAVREGLSSLNS